MPDLLRSLELRIPPPAIMALAVVAAWGVARLWPSHFGLPLWGLIVSALIAFAGLAVALVAVLSFKSVKTTVSPTRPDATRHIVSSGVYRYTRNPMYLGLLLMLCAWAIYLANPLAALVLPLFTGYLTRFQIKPEERILLAKFGLPYEQYVKQVRRWV